MSRGATHSPSYCRAQVDAALTSEARGNYSEPMRAKIVRIGNSQGVRIPKPLLLRSGLTVEVEIDAQDDQIVIRPARRPREDWEDSFLRMAASGDDRLPDDDVQGLSQFDDEDWSW